MDTQTLMTVVIQGGAVVVLAVVLNEVNKKIDLMIDLNNKLVNKLIDMLDQSEMSHKNGQ